LALPALALVVFGAYYSYPCNKASGTLKTKLMCNEDETKQAEQQIS